MSLMPRAFIKKKPKELRRNGLPSAWIVIDEASKMSIGMPLPIEAAQRLIKLIQPENGLPIRNLLEECPHMKIYGVPSIKNDRILRGQSSIESSMLHLLEVHPAVSGFVEQPFAMSWQDFTGVYHKHIPDFFVRLRNGLKLAIEVKPDSALNNLEIQERTLFFSRNLPACHSMLYLLIVESQIKGQEDENARIIDKYEFIKISDADFYEIEQIFRRYPCDLNLKVIDVMHSKSHISKLREKVRMLIRNGVIGLDMEKPFTKQSPLFWRGAFRE